MKRLFLTIAIIAPMIVSCGGNSKNAADNNDCCGDSSGMSISDYQRESCEDPNDAFVETEELYPRVRHTGPKKAVTLDQLQGSWSLVGLPGYVDMWIRGDTLNFPDSDPCVWYTVSVVGSNTLKIVYNESDSDFEAEEKEMEKTAWFEGDTLYMDEGVGADIPYLPFGTICIGGKRVDIDFHEQPDEEAKYVDVINRLAKDPFRNRIFDEWDCLYSWTENNKCHSMIMDNLAELYLKHPLAFLSWAYACRDIDNVSRDFFSNKGSKKLTKDRVMKDIQRIPNQKARTVLTEKIANWK